MMFLTRLSLLFLVLLLSACERHSPSDKEGEEFVTDDLGRKVAVTPLPKRIISLAPNITEILFALHAEETLVGVTNYCDYPEETKYKPRVGGLMNPNLERIVELKPDLIVMTVSGNTREDFDAFERLGIPTFVSHPQFLEGIYKSIIDIGRLTGNIHSADSVVNALRQKQERYLASILTKRKVRVLFLISIRPIISAASGTFIDELLQSAGAINVAHGAQTSYPLLNKEEIFRTNPEAIITTSDVAHSIDAIIDALPEFKDLPAIKQRRIAIVDADLVSRPGPRIIEGLKLLITAIHESSQDHDE